jgi:hypothetical protein
VLARLTAALTCVGLLLGSPVQAEPPSVPLPHDEFDPVSITAVERSVEPVPAPAVVDPVPAPAPMIVELPDQPVRCVADRRCRGMRIAAAVLGGVGLAAVGTGIGLIARKDRVLPDSPAFVTSTQPAGLVVTTIGVGVTLTAVLVLVASRSATRAPAPVRAARFEPLGLRF